MAVTYDPRGPRLPLICGCNSPMQNCGHGQGEFTLSMVKWTGKLVILVLALSLWASPLVACMLPDAMLSAEERECCLTMANDCGDMEMPASHACCTVTVKETGP